MSTEESGALSEAPYSHISGLLAARASSVVCFEAEVEVLSALSSSSCWGGYLKVGSGAAEARGTSPWGWPGKLPWSFPASASRRGQAGVQTVGAEGVLFPLCAALTLTPGQFSDKSRGLGGIEPSPTTF